MSRPKTMRRLLLSGAIVATTALAAPMLAGVATAAPSAPSRVAEDPTPAAPAPTADPDPNPAPTASPPRTQSPEDAAAAAARAAEKAAEAAKRKAEQAAEQKAEDAALKAAQEAAAQAAKDEAERQAKLAQQAAEAAAKAQARAAKEAAQRAAAAQRASVTWNHRGRPNKLVIVRQTSIDSIAKGELVQRVVRNGRTVTLAALDAAIPASWASIDGDTARLGAAVVLTPGTLFDVEGIQTLQLAGGNNPSDAAFLYTGSGRLQLRGVTVTSVDPATGQAVGAGAQGRPYIRISNQGKLDATDSTIADLGTKPTGDLPGEAAVTFGGGGSGTLTGTTFQRNSTGLMLSGSQSVKLQDITVATSTENGLVLREDRGTVFSGIKAEHNGDNGVLVTGATSPRPINGISTNGNHSYGVSLTGQKNIEISDLNLSGDQAGGLELNRITDSRVHNVVTTNEPTGVFLHVNSTNVVLDGMAINGGRTGIQVEKTTKGLRITGGTIDGARVAGMAIGGRDTLLDGLAVKASRTGVRVERGASGVTANRLSIVGGTDGLVTSGGTTGIVITDLTADGVGNDAIRSLSSGLQITGGQIRGGNTGMDLQAASTVTGLQVGLTSLGIRARATEPIVLDNVTVDAVSVGVEAQPGSVVTLRNSSVHALEAVRGTIALEGADDLSLPAINLLGAIGLPLILLAVVLEALHILRQRRFGPTRRPMPPAIPVGAG